MANSSSTMVVPATKPKELVVGKKEAKEFKMITLTRKFSYRARDMFETLIDENRWKGFTKMIYCWDLLFSQIVK